MWPHGNVAWRVRACGRVQEERSQGTAGRFEIAAAVDSNRDCRCACGSALTAQPVNEQSAESLRPSTSGDREPCSGMAAQERPTEGDDGERAAQKSQPNNWSRRCSPIVTTPITQLALSSTRAECALRCSPSARPEVRRPSHHEGSRSCRLGSQSRRLTGLRPLTDALISPSHLMLTVPCLLAMYPSSSSF